MIVICGETLIDLVPAGAGLWRALPGGSPANTAVALARLSTPTVMLARISDDAFGAALRERLSANGVATDYVVDAAEPSTLAIVSFDPAGGARYTFHVEGTADWQWRPRELPQAFPDDVVAIHAGSMALIKGPGGPVLESLLTRERSRRIISIDPNVRPAMCEDPLRYSEIVERWVSLSHIIKVSADDVGWLYPDRALDSVVADWASRGPALVVATLGGDGALGQTSRGAIVRVPGIAVDVVDTIGAGDTFSAALLHALEVANRLDVASLPHLTSSDLESALRFAVRASALACTREGADPPYLADLCVE